MRSLLLLAALQLAAGPLGAAPGPRRFVFRHHGPEQGLENQTVTSLAQDKTGFLWAGTQEGAFRFDGHRFVRFGRADGLPSELVDAVHVSRDGTLWVATDLGVARLEGARFRAFGPAEGLATDALGTQPFAEDGEGRLWVVDAEGLRVQDGPRFQAIDLGPAFTAHEMESVASGPDGAIWVGARGQVARRTEGSVEVLDTGDGVPDERVEALLVARDGALWIRTASRLLRRPKEGGRFEDRTGRLPPSNSFGSLMEDEDGVLWVPTDFGLARSRPDGGWEVVGASRGLTADAVLSVLRDRDGSVWVGLAGGGLDRWLGYPRWSALTTAEGLNNDAVWAIERDREGALLVGTDRGLNHIDPTTGAIRTWQAADGLPGHCVFVIGPEEDGTVLLGFFPGGIVRFDPRRGPTAERYGVREGLRSSRVFDLARDPEGTLWAATAAGLQRLAGRRFESVVLPEGDVDEPIRALHVDAARRLWAAGRRGLAVREGGTWRRLTRKDGLKDDQVGYLASDAEGRVWIGYWEPIGAARLRLTGGALQVEPFDTGRGLASDSVEALAVDGAGDAWLGTSRGVHRVRGSTVARFTAADGLLWDYVNVVRADADGGLWVGTSRGLAHLAPGRRRPPRPPTLVITDVRLDGQPVDAQRPPRAASAVLEVSFTAVTFRRPDQVVFRYRLAGFEDVVETRARSVRYPRLPPGSYVFEVEARDDEGGTSAPVRLEVRLLPPWYRTTAAHAAFAGLALVALAGGYLLRVRQHVHARRELEEAVRQRTAEVERQNQRLAEQASALAAAAEERRQVYTTIVHDLKNPLTPLLGGVELLAASVGTSPGPVQQTLDRMRQSGRRLLFLIDSYTTMARVGGDGPGWRGFSARDMTAELALAYEPAARQRGLTLLLQGRAPRGGDDAPRGGALVDASPGAVYRALENLIGNALKYAGREVRLAVEEDASSVALVVENDGERIAPEDRARVFELFEQLPQSPSRPGSGVGLFSARRQVEEQGGRIVIEDAADGVRFKVVFPRSTRAVVVSSAS